MTARFVAAATILLCLALPAQAQNLAVRSGEHADFSRFVVRLPRGVAWTLDTGQSMARLSVENAQIRFDTSQVFARIPKKRVSRVSQSRAGAPLEFRLTCRCRVESFRQGELLVIDVRDGGVPPAGKPVQLPFPTVQDAYRFRLGPGYAAPAHGPRPSGAPPVTARAPGPAEPAEPAQPIAPVSLPLDLRTAAQTPDLDLPAEERMAARADASRANRVMQLEQRLLEEIARASDQGLIDPLLPAPQTDTPQANRPETAQSLPEPPRATGNVAVQSAIDRELADVARILNGANPGRSCLPPRQVALHDWGDETRFVDQIGYWRGQIVGEFDEVDTAAVLGLARTYLHFGFGAEARSALDLLEREPVGAAALRALSGLIDSGTTPAPNPFAGMESCDSDVALWALYAHPASLSNANSDAVLRAIARLPEELRQHVGPKISQLFSDGGRADAAEAVLRAVERIDNAENPELLLAGAAAAELRGNHKEAEKQRLELVGVDAAQSPKALMALIEARFEKRETVTPDLSQLAASYATEFGESDLGPDLRHAHALALALTGEFPQAFAQLAERAALDGNAEHGRTAVPLLTLLAERSDDLTFLRYGLATSATDKGALPEDLGDKIARRLLDLGFADEAVAFLSGRGETPVSPRRRLLQAETALGRGLPHEAMIVLLGLDSPDATRLRADAMVMKRDHALAAETLLMAQDSAGAARSLWLSDGWQAIPEGDDSEYGRIAGIAHALESPGETPDTPLARAQALLDDASTARAGINDILESLEVNPVSEE